MAERMLSSTDKLLYESVFEIFDPNFNGVITKAEMISSF